MAKRAEWMAASLGPILVVKAQLDGGGKRRR